MENNFIYPKNYFQTKPLSLEDSKWNIYNPFNSNINNSNINNLYKNKKDFNLYENKVLTNYKLDPIINKDLDKKVENIKLSIYSKLNKNSSQLVLYLEKIKYLTQENISLKQIIKNKDKIISDFEILFTQLKAKFIKMDNINQTLKNKIINKYNINKELNLDNNKNDLLDCFNVIKEDLNKIENDYNKKLKEKDEILEKMNKELIYIHNEYKNLSEILEKMNNYIMKTNYNELKKEVNKLLKEKEFLLKQNENREKRIIDLQKKNEQVLNYNNNDNDNDNENEKINMNIFNNDDLIVTFKNQENEYVKTINMLENKIIEKDKEII